MNVAEGEQTTDGKWTRVRTKSKESRPVPSLLRWIRATYSVDKMLECQLQSTMDGSEFLSRAVLHFMVDSILMSNLSSWLAQGLSLIWKIQVRFSKQADRFQIDDAKRI